MAQLFVCKVFTKLKKKTKRQGQLGLSSNPKKEYCSQNRIWWDFNLHPIWSWVNTKYFCVINDDQLFGGENDQQKYIKP